MKKVNFLFIYNQSESYKKYHMQRLIIIQLLFYFIVNKNKKYI